MSSSLVFLSLLFSPVLASLSSDRFHIRSTAEELLNHPSKIIQLYFDHKAHRSTQETTALESILESIHTDTVLSATKNAPKHIFTVLSDDQGWSDIGYNDETFVTPTIDFFADKGIKFDNFYVQCTCTPTRSSLLTGRYTTKTGLQDAPIIPGERRNLPLDMKTMPDYFKEAGYSTALIGKWHLGHEFLSMTPNARGYDYFFGNLGGAYDHFSKDIGVGCGSEENGFQDIFSDNCRFFNGYDLQENGMPYFDQQNFSTDILADKAVALVMKHNPETPILLNFQPNVPHAPVKCPESLYSLCDGVSESTHGYQPYFRQKVCGMVASIDIAMLRIVLALYMKDMLSSTLILYFSDNGGLIQAGSNNKPYREGKGSMYEGGIHVPAFMYGHGVNSPYSLVSHRKDLIHVSDVLPTLLGYANIDTRHIVTHFDGFNHWDNLVLGKPLKRNRVPVNAASIKVGFFSGYIQKAFNQTWKYMFNPNVLIWAGLHQAASTRARYKIEGEFLYNLSEDPYEETNLIPYVDRFNHTDLHVMEVLNLLRFELLALRASSVTSQLTNIPPDMVVFPSNLGCWLPKDSPYYNTVKCPVPTPFTPENVFSSYNLTAIAMNVDSEADTVELEASTIVDGLTEHPVCDA
eukprot:CAMPEP_0185020972 /NCGR_PEP_ID=MMETSP1103-20130426/3619_1 /TAXON_ID=36769 /ORGANISM="Paraphysomonas bandaiensis, Strain Caron Lab Isolate" /LENGTH=632 /DNA_ID=CAMNT_0027552207 /DNA_START=125 /DNA_END=2023 /DNA_ORIENTATION=-